MNLEAFLRDVLTPLLDHPDTFKVEITGEGRRRDVLIYADPQDRGRIIGKHGRMISALRTLAKTAGEKAGLAVELELYDGDEQEA
ncbi:MAG: KH domain-containing protein [Acidobacteria bacterium]|nr:KH domain-containing protein [Acidobacteriota bacterium]MBI3488318.1 KH domain-containing protein [Acidobacteriota bacterium]